MSFKDTHRLKELDALIHELPDTIKAHQVRLDDVNFYSRDPAGFASTMKALEAAQEKLASAEEEWLALEEKREALAG
jgi:ATP-binding cassette subfamily F protein uup